MASAQSAEPFPAPVPSATATAGKLQGFRGIHVGMTLEQVKAELQRESLFLYRGDRDVSIVPATGQPLIEVEGRAYVERGYFQFHENRLLVLIVTLARELVSYYEVYSALTASHGPATTLDPSAAVWVLDGLRLSLEKPVTLKYVDIATFEALATSGRSGTDYELMTRQAFLDTL